MMYKLWIFKYACVRVWLWKFGDCMIFGRIWILRFIIEHGIGKVFMGLNYWLDELHIDVYYV